MLRLNAMLTKRGFKLKSLNTAGSRTIWVKGYTEVTRQRTTVGTIPCTIVSVSILGKPRQYFSIAHDPKGEEALKRLIYTL